MEQKTKTCPYCGEEIPIEAKKCRYCGEWLVPEQQQPTTPQQSNTSQQPVVNMRQTHPHPVSNQRTQHAQSLSSNRTRRPASPKRDIQPQTFEEVIKKCFSKYATFSGRATRREFWYFAFFELIVSTILLCMAYVFEDEGSASGILALIWMLFGLATLIPSLAVGTRRLHDIGYSGWLQLLYFVPMVGAFILIVFWAKKGEGNNKYGLDPEGID